MTRTVPKKELLAMAGHWAEPSPWMTIDQQRIDRFSEATGDYQYIHNDPEKAAETPFGSTIAHGFLTLSLVSPLSESVLVVPEGLVMAINYGLNKVRFLAPVKVGSRIRLRARISDVVEKAPDKILVTAKLTTEIEGEETPALIAESLVMYVVA